MFNFRIEREDSTFTNNDGNQEKYHSGKQSFAIHSSDKQAMKAIIILMNINFEGCMEYHEDFSDYYQNGELTIWCVNNVDVDFFKECYKTEKKYLNS